jgi:DNA recombination protein RmuC
LEVLIAIVGTLIGFGACYFLLTQKSFNESIRFRSENERLKDELEKIQLQEERLQTRIVDLSSLLSAKETEGKHLLEKLKEERKQLEAIQEKFAREFQHLANQILEEKSKKFTEQNKTNLSDLLNPLKERIVEFERKVEHNSKESSVQHAALKEQLFQLKDLNQKITKEAENLTKALKGDTKTQGNWGEFILESILEKSGLQKDREYFIQQSFSVEGKRFQPDVIIKLPEEKSIVIDSKVSLIAYEKYVSEDHEDKTLQAHLLSVRKHIKDLSEKKYQQIYGLDGLDFILMFIPIEPAFSLAIQADNELFNDAYGKNIVMVSPSTLIATLRTIANIWKHEYQNNNAIEIARQGGNLYDKFVEFCNDLIAIGNNLDRTRTTYDQAMKKLVDGKDNLVRKTERIKELGAKTSKEIDQRLLNRTN